MNKTDWYKKAIVYQIYPFSFKDSNNDGWGDIPGIISKLDYLKDLGITAIWFSPLYRSPDYDYGYDISDYRDIDPKFGTMDDFRLLLKECHSRNIKVIMDMVVNHSSTEHKWFVEAMKDKNSAYRDYYIIQKGKKKKGKLYPPTNWASVFTGTAWENIEGSEDYYLHLFCKEQADLNWENPKLRQEVIDIFNFYLDMGVDGFRMDVFNVFSKVYPLKDGKKKIAGTGEEYYIDGPRMHEFLKELNEKSFSRYDSFVVGESYVPHPEEARKYVEENNHEINALFDFAHLNSDCNGKYFRHRLNLLQFKDGLLNAQRRTYGHAWNTLVLENHDNARSNCRFGIDPKKYHYEASTFLPTITFLGFGTPFIYQGEEIGMSDAIFSSIDQMKDPVSHFVDGMMRKFPIPSSMRWKFLNSGARDHARVPMQWDDSVNGGFNEGKEPWQNCDGFVVRTNVSKDLSAQKSIYRFYQKLIQFKKEDEAAIYGDIKEYDHKNRKIICYSRTYQNETLLIFGNFSDREVSYSLPEEFRNKDKELIIHNYDDEQIKDSYLLHPYEAFVYKIVR